MICRVGAVLWLGLLGCDTPGSSRRAETVAVEPLPIGADTVVVPWTNVPEAAWLGGRRWAVVGADHEAASIVDFATRSATRIGGPKPTELAKPFGVFSIGDTAFIADWGMQRTTLWTSDGTLVGSIPAPAGTRGNMPKARDAAGQYYFEVPPIAGPDGSGLKDSTAVVRGNPTLTVFDTVANLAPLDIAEIAEQRGRRYERIVFSGTDWWGIRPDGRLWVARVRRNEVSVFEGRKERRGERLPDPVLEVKRPDREQYIQAFPDELRSMAEKLPFAPLRPPFERGFPGVDGAVWLRKSKMAVDSIRRYHLVDTTRALSRVFTTFGNGLIIAAGRETVLLAEQFKGGIRLMEIQLPAAPPPTAPR
ncbi:MAG: hypothetical protein EXR94_10435 [Gemmatimonadetes bacterium]|nr:hypothetical protein [Gemmatimonadota bacterium]